MFTVLLDTCVLLPPTLCDTRPSDCATERVPVVCLHCTLMIGGWMPSGSFITAWDTKGYFLRGRHYDLVVVEDKDAEGYSLDLAVCTATSKLPVPERIVTI